LTGTFNPTFGQSTNQGKFVCLPCETGCDRTLHNAPDTCTHYGLKLLPKAQVKSTKITPNQVCDRVNTNSKVIVLDVRIKRKFESTREGKHGRLKNAINRASKK